MLNQLLYHNDLFSIFAIVGGSFLVLSIMSLIDGWYKVSRKYRRQNVTSGKLFPFAYMYLGVWKYSGAVFVRVGEEGLDISIILPFRFLHPPLLIPWDAFDSCAKTRLYFSQCTQLTLKNPKYTFYFRGQLANEIEKCYQQFADK